ncbi:MAG: TetR/AcrR family transcriptional regulator [Acidimicrobiales bacterium]
MTRAEQREQTWARIVAAAVESFAELGFDASSTRDIARRAGVTQGLVTYYFASKDELWRAAADQIFGAFDDLPDRPAPNAAVGDDTAREAIRSFVRFAAHHPELFAFVVDTSRRDDDRLRWLVETHLQARYDAVAGLAARLYGDQGTALAPHLYYGLTGAASLMFALSAECRALTGVDPATDERIERHAELVAQLLVPG